jgi:hypothetical protein
MSLSPCPNELQCLAVRVQADAQALLAFVDRLPPAYRTEIMLVMRALAFDADRLMDLADCQTDALRNLFEKTTFMVDDLRTSAAMDGGWSKTLENAMGHAADLQRSIRAQFPGEEFPGGA